MPFDPSKPFEIEESSSAPAVGFDPNLPFEVVPSSSNVPTGGLGAPVSRDYAKMLAGERVLARAEEAGSSAGLTLGSRGEILQTRSPLSEPRTIIEGVARGGSLGLSDAIAKLAFNADLKSENQPRVQNPELFAGSEFVGGLLPTGIIGKAIVNPGARLAEKVIGGIRTGFPLGAIAGASDILTEKGRETTLNEFITNTLTGGAVGGAVGGLLPSAVTGGIAVAKGTGKAIKNVLTNPLKTLENLGVLQSPESLAVRILNPKGNDVREVAESVTSGRLLTPFQNIKAEGHFNDAPTFIVNGKKALSTKGTAIESFIDENPSIKFNGSNTADAMVAEVASDPLLVERNPEVIALIKSNADVLRRDIPLKEVFDRLKAINSRHENYFTASVKGQNTKLQDAEFATDEIMRKNLSRGVNDTIEGVSGIAENPFREYGAISDVVQKVTKGWHDAMVNRLNQVGRGGAEDFLTKFDISKPGTWIAPASYLKGGELGKFNKSIDSLNKILPKKQGSIVLSTEERLSKLEGKVATPPVINPEGQAPILTPEDIRNAQIAQSLSSQNPPSVSPEVLSNAVLRDIETARALQASSPQGLSYQSPSFNPPSAPQTQELLGRTLQDLIQEEAGRRARIEAAGTLGFF